MHLTPFAGLTLHHLPL
uniref:Uncharacterized protein n=1 Tax=Arundo donax TaxID=35708 RepID=A0A0A9QBH7_ARUDO